LAIPPRQTDWRRHRTCFSRAIVLQSATSCGGGFNLDYAITSGSFEEFVDHAVPVLTERGACQSGCAPDTYRNKPMGKDDLLPTTTAARGR
jgi:hypothetical protein